MPVVVNDLDKAETMSTKSAQEAFPACDATGSHNRKAKFPQFKKFPIEVRLKVWGYLEPAPVIIKPLAPFIGQHRYIRPVPVLLQICRETRTEYITRADDPKDHITYTLCNDLGAWPRYKKIWVSLEKDSVVIDPFLALQSALVPGSDIYNIRNPIILWKDSDYDSIMCFFCLVLCQFTNLNILTIAWTPKEDADLVGDTEDGEVDEDTLSDEQNEEYILVEEHVREWIKQIVETNPDWNIEELKFRTLNGLWEEFSAKEHEARLEFAKARMASL